MSKILVAEDEPVLRMLITDTLEDEGYEVDNATDGEEALTKIRGGSYSVAIVDHMMPRMTGLEVISMVRQQSAYPTLKMIMLSAKSQQSDREKAMDIGADVFMAKPFSPKELVRVVGELLNG